MDSSSHRISWSLLLLSNKFITFNANGVPVGLCSPCTTTLLQPLPIVSDISMSSYTRVNVFGLFRIAIPVAFIATLSLTNTSPRVILIGQEKYIDGRWIQTQYICDYIPSAMKDSSTLSSTDTDNPFFKFRIIIDVRVFQQIKNIFSIKYVDYMSEFSFIKWNTSNKPCQIITDLR